LDYAEAVVEAGFYVMVSLIGLCWAGFAALAGIYFTRFLNGTTRSVIFGMIVLRRERVEAREH
jgi:hypothetical protein